MMTRKGLAIYLLGAPRIEQDGKPVELDTRKALALLAYLVVRGGIHQRDALAALLYPDSDQTRARGALRRTLSTLHKGLGRGALEISRESVEMSAMAGEWLDVAEFHRFLESGKGHLHPPAEVCPACLADLESGVKLYRDDFMAGFGLRDSAEFDDWQFFQAESLRQEMATALQKLAQGYAQEGDYEKAIVHARRWSAIDPLLEEAHRQLMQLYAWSGQRTVALRQYRECVRILEQELGVPPLEETVQLYQAILESRLQAPPKPSRKPDFQPSLPTSSASQIADPSPALNTTPTSRTFPLVGRDREWQALLKAFASAKPNGWLVVLEGELGIGKTRLAEEFVAYAKEQGAQVMQARCYQGESDLAYSPLITGLNYWTVWPEGRARLAAVPVSFLTEVARLAPGIQPLVPSPQIDAVVSSPWAQSRLFESLRQVILHLLSGQAPGVLFIDDLQWADTASLDFLLYLVRRLEGMGLVVLATWRSDATRQVSHLQHLLSEGLRSGQATDLRLSRLSASDLIELVRSRDIPPTTQVPDFSQRLYEESEGLPFFAIEYLEAAFPAGDEPKTRDWHIPGSVREALLARLGILDEASRQLLDAAAVIGRSFDLQTLREASGRSENETVNGLEKLLTLGLIVERGEALSTGDVVYDFTHDKLRSTAYEQSSLARRRLLHRRVADALANPPNNRRDPGATAGLIAGHFLQAGQDAQAAFYYKLAGEHARSLYANREAITHFQAAIAAGHSETAELHEAIGDLHLLLGEYHAALTELDAAAALCKSNNLARMEHKLGEVHARLGEWETAECHFQAALEMSDPVQEYAWQALVYTDWSRTAHQRGQTDQALDLARQSLTMAEASQDQHSLAQAHNILGMLARSRGDLDQACHHLTRSLEIAEAMGEPGLRTAALNNLALFYNASGDVSQAIILAKDALEICHLQGDRHREAALLNNLADLYHAAGQEQQAMAHLTKAVVIFAEIGIDASGREGGYNPEIWKLTEW